MLIKLTKVVSKLTKRSINGFNELNTDLKKIKLSHYKMKLQKFSVILPLTQAYVHIFNQIANRFRKMTNNTTKPNVRLYTRDSYKEVV